MMKTLRFFVPTLLLLMNAATLGFGQTPEKNKAATLAFYDVLNNRQWDKIGNYIADDVIDHALPPDYIENSGLKGPELVGMFIQELTKGFPDVKFTPKQCIAEGDLVMCYISMSGTHGGDFAGLSPTGRKFKVYDVDIIRFDKQGKAVEHWAIQDGSALMAFLGAAPPSSAGQVVKDFFSTVNANDLSAAKRYVSADYSMHHPMFPQPLTIDEHFNSSIKTFHDAFADFKHTLLEVHVSGNTVAVRGLVTGKHSREFMGAPASGVNIDVPWLGLITLNEEGKIKEIHVQFNQLAFLAQIGASPMAKK